MNYKRLNILFNFKDKKFKEKILFIKIDKQRNVLKDIEKHIIKTTIWDGMN